MTCTLKRVVVSAFLAISCSTSSAQAISDDSARIHFIAASKLVYRASAKIFKCLSDSRDKAAAPDLDNAVYDLKDAYGEYGALLNGRATAKFYAEKHDTEATEAFTHLKSVLVGNWSKVNRIETEAQVAQLNQEAINRMLGQVSNWDKACAKPSKQLNVYLDFIKNKILLEKASSLAEIAWNK